MTENNQKKWITVVTGALAASAFLLVALYNPAPKEVTVSHILPPDAYADTNLIAKAAFVYKPNSGEVLFSKNSQAQLPLASITKVMSAIIAKENLASATKVSFMDSNWSVSDLLNYTLMVSSNEGMNALAAASVGLGGSLKRSDSDGERSFLDHAGFIKEMNKKATELNLHQTYFIDVAGLDVSDMQSGAYGSAIDVAKLFAYALQSIPNELEATTLDDALFYTADDAEYSAINTNKAIGAIPGLIAGKTGYTDLAGGNLVVAFDAGMNDPIIVVVLGSTKEGRFTDIEQLVRASLYAE